MYDGVVEVHARRRRELRDLPARRARCAATSPTSRQRERQTSAMRAGLLEVPVRQGGTCASGRCRRRSPIRRRPRSSGVPRADGGDRASGSSTAAPTARSPWPSTRGSMLMRPASGARASSRCTHAEPARPGDRGAGAGRRRWRRGSASSSGACSSARRNVARAAHRRACARPPAPVPVGGALRRAAVESRVVSASRAGNALHRQHADRQPGRPERARDRDAALGRTRSSPRTRGTRGRCSTHFDVHHAARRVSRAQRGEDDAGARRAAGRAATRSR